MDYKGIEYLRRKLDAKRVRVLLRYNYYEMKNGQNNYSPVIPPKLKEAYASTVGWCSKSVDALADRLVFRSFGEDDYDLEEIFRMNNKDILIDSAILSALVSSCSFVYITPSLEGMPRLQVIDGGNATGIIDPITNMLVEGYAVLQRTKGARGTPIIEAYFTQEKTVIYRNGKEAESYDNPAPYALLVPIINRPDAARPFGHSRISRAQMNLQRKAQDTLTRTEVTAEFYSFPQKYVTGLADDADPLDAWKATISSMISFTKDADGDHPILGQFAQQSMQPHLEQFKMYASAFAGETGLTLDDLGFPTDNPSSSEAIKAAHETLRLTAKKAQRDFGTGFLNVGYLAACLRDGIEYNRSDFSRTSVIWQPVFEPDASTLAAIGDGAIKVNTAVPGYFDADNLGILTGFNGG